jgi:hypothetical protein
MRKKVKKRKKLFRVNVVIAYDEAVDINLLRTPLHEMLRNLAWLHSLDYSISADHQNWHGVDSSDETLSNCTQDLIYFRESENTRIGAKDLRNLISCIFDKSGLLFLQVELFCQLCKFLPKYPFPKVYFRFLNFPFVERRGLGDPKCYLPTSILLDAIEKEQKFALN